MIITQKQLRRIIREELYRINEGGEEAVQGVKDDLKKTWDTANFPIKHQIKTIWELDKNIYKWLAGDIQIEELSDAAQNAIKQWPKDTMSTIQGLRDNAANVFRLHPVLQGGKFLMNLWK